MEVGDLHESTMVLKIAKGRDRPETTALAYPPSRSPHTLIAALGTRDTATDQGTKRFPRADSGTIMMGHAVFSGRAGSVGQSLARQLNREGQALTLLH